MNEAENFIWCPADCGSGQIHLGGNESPEVTCVTCGHLSCFKHKISWHEGITCEQYDDKNGDHDKTAADVEVKIVSDEETAVPRWTVNFAKWMIAKKTAEANRRHRKENSESQDMIGKTTKRCPGCNAAIEKNEGW